MCSFSQKYTVLLKRGPSNCIVEDVKTHEHFFCSIFPKNELFSEKGKFEPNLQCFEDSVRIHQQMSRHSNVDRLVDFVDDKNNFYEITEYRKYTIEEIIFSEYAAFSDGIYVIKAFYQILKAVSFIHKCGFAHLDITPSNIYINPEGDVKITNFHSSQFFGLSEFVSLKNSVNYSSFISSSPSTSSYSSSSLISTGNKKSNFCFKAPEIKNYQSGGLFSGPAADSFSCGMIFYYMLARIHENNHVLFEGQNNELNNINKNKNNYNFYDFPNDKYENIIYKNLTKNEEVRNLINGLITKDVSKRLSANDALKSPLFSEFFAECTSQKLTFLEGRDFVRPIVSLRAIDEIFDKNERGENGENAEDNDDDGIGLSLLSLERKASYVCLKYSNIERCVQTDGKKVVNLTHLKKRNERRRKIPMKSRNISSLVSGLRSQKQMVVV